MQIVKTVVWQDGEAWLGYLQEYPDYWTQGESLTELRENLADLYGMFADKTIPGIRQVAELEVETA